MRAIEIANPGPNGQLQLVENYPGPKPKAGEVLIRVACAALNRADIFQKQGKYPPPQGTSPLPGLEVSGEIVALGEGVTRRKIGEKVCALLEGGGYAEYATAAVGQVFTLPAGFSFAEAAALPEALFTVWLALFETARLAAGDTVLIHGGASGIGHMAIQMARAAEAIPFATAGTDEKCDFCRKLGAEQAINYRKQDVLEAFQNRPFDIILDIVGGETMQKNLKLLAPGGRMISLAFLAGSRAELNMASLLFKQASWHGLTLRSRTATQKAYLASRIREHCWPWLISRRIFPAIDSEFPLEQAEKAQNRMEQNLNLGKILLKVADL